MCQVFNKKQQLPQDVQSPSSLSAKKRRCLKVNVLPSTKLNHSMIVLLQSLTLQKLLCDHIHVTGFDVLTQVCRVTQDQRIEMSVLDQIGRKDFLNWMQVVKHSLLGMHGYTLSYKWLCIFPYFSQWNAHVLRCFAKLLVDVGTPIPMRQFWRFARRFQVTVRECESSRGSGDHGVIFSGWYPSIKGMKDQSTW